MGTVVPARTTHQLRFIRKTYTPSADSVKVAATAVLLAPEANGFLSALAGRTAVAIQLDGHLTVVPGRSVLVRKQRPWWRFWRADSVKTPSTSAAGTMSIWIWREREWVRLNTASMSVNAVSDVGMVQCLDDTMLTVCRDAAQVLWPALSPLQVEVVTDEPAAPAEPTAPEAP